MRNICSVPECESFVRGHGLCNMHLLRWQRHGDVNHRRPRRPLEDRFWSKVVRGGEDECWLWSGAIRSGYGFVNEGGRGRSLPAHRVSYELLVGPIPEGLTIDHLCRVRNCVNPRHLEPVTLSENVKRKPPAPPFCPQGHEFTAENTARSTNGGRICRTCKRSRDRQRRQAA